MSESSAARIAVSLQPGASSDTIIGFADGVLRVSVKAPPRDGQANYALLRLLGKSLKIAPSNIAILRGERTRRKLLSIVGMSQEQLDCRLTILS